MHIFEFTGVNFWLQEFLTNAIARVAVPFFALSSGIFFFLRYVGLSSYFRNIKKRISTLLIPYLIATSVIFIFYYVHFVFYKGNLYEITVQALLSDIFLRPISVQFWFLRDLMTLIVFSPFIYWLVTKTSNIYIILLAACWVADFTIFPLVYLRPLIATETLFFFSLGCFFVTQASKRWEKFFAEAIGQITIIQISILFIMIIVRIYIDPEISVGFGESRYNSLWSLLLQKTIILFGIYILIVTSFQISNPKILHLSNFTFFVYLYHLLPLSLVVGKIGYSILDERYAFYINFPLATFMSFNLAYLLNKYLTTCYRILTGSR